MLSGSDNTISNSTQASTTNQEPSLSTQAGVRIAKPHQFDANKPQTIGMQRLAVISHDLAGSEGLY